MSGSPILPRVGIVLFCAVLGSSLGTLLQALRITGNPHQRWLLEQLPQWERDGLLTADAARTLRERHVADASRPSWLRSTSARYSKPTASSPRANPPAPENSSIERKAYLFPRVGFFSLIGLKFGQAHPSFAILAFAVIPPLVRALTLN